MDPKAILDQGILVVEKAIQYGVAVDVALKAFRERLFPAMGAASNDSLSPNYSSCKPDFKAVVDEHVDAVKGA